jgi:alpha-ketoglutarate-dependent taurine dioxygenase
MSGIVQRCVLSHAGRLPLMLDGTRASIRLVEYVREHRQALQDVLLEHGAVLLRGFGVATAEDFDGVVEAISSQRLSYTYRSTPRTADGRNLFTATEYPATEEIPLHNENAYQRKWPKYVVFCCLQAPRSGGETPLADLREVTSSIPPALFRKFACLRVKYLRTYRPSLDLSWQTVFQTQDRTAVAQYCAEHDIDYEWLDTETLRTTQVCQGVALHPALGEVLFFNQAHLFHVSSVGQENAETLLRLFGADGLPRHARYGNDSEIGASELQQVRSAYAQHAVTFSWQSGDVLLIDNMQVAHGRRPYTGSRRILAALLEVFSPRIIRQASNLRRE